jgi:diguanylate cyclase (GGDEF)-like protein
MHQAHHDPLTGLANRALLLARAGVALNKAPAKGEQVALLFLDLDDFKQVNDALGHREGDRLLQEIALRVQMSCRSNDVVARLGGDEFAVLLVDPAGQESARRIAGRILDELRAPYAMLRGRMRPSTSIGIACVDSNVGAEELLRRADVAMYAAKARGKDNLCVYEAAMDVPLKERLRLEGDLRDSVRQWTLAVFYQPVVSMLTGDIMGVEALLRWNHPDSGLLLPCDFLPIAEATGLMVPIGHRVLLEACVEVANWRSLPQGGDLFVSVNLSGPELRHPELKEHVTEALRRSGLRASHLVLEVTENALLGDEEAVNETLSQLHELGIRVAIDDFGTHYSSLSYLKNLPVHVLKLDRSFVSDLTTDPRSNEIVRAVSRLSSALGVDLIAEGVERAEQRDELLRLGCDLGQGYFFYRPRPCYEMRECFGGGGEVILLHEADDEFALPRVQPPWEDVAELEAVSNRPVLPARVRGECALCGRPVSLRKDELLRLTEVGHPVCCSDHTPELWMEGFA